MKTYTIKPEYLELYGPEATENTKLTEDEVGELARAWSTPEWELQDQLIPEDGKWRYWFAVQRDREDEWDNGSYILGEAKDMARRMGAQLIAVIDEGNGEPVCVDEIPMEES